MCWRSNSRAAAAGGILIGVPRSGCARTSRAAMCLLHARARTTASCSRPSSPSMRAQRTSCAVRRSAQGTKMRLRVGIDVGGTFTDVSAFDEDAGELVAVRKYLSHPKEPAAVMERITQDLADEFGTDCVSLILHGSTVALNTLLEDRGARA